MKRELLFWAILLLGLATLVGVWGCGAAFTDTVVSAEDGRLTVENKSTLARQTHVVAGDAKIVKDGEPAMLEDLLPGDTVEVSTEVTEDGISVAKTVVAESPAPAAPPKDGAIEPAPEQVPESSPADRPGNSPETQPGDSQPEPFDPLEGGP